MTLKKRLIYISSVNLLLSKAQSYQINKFVKSLCELCIKKDIKFRAYSLSGVPENYSKFFDLAKIRFTSNRFINNLFMIIFLLKTNKLKKVDILFSRDLLILFVFALLGRRTIYEYHHPGPLVHTFIFRIFNFLPNTSVVTISNALKSHLLKTNFRYSKEVLVLPSATDLKKYSDSPNRAICRKQLKMKDNLFYVLHTGSPYNGRGVENFIDICKVSEDIFFIHIGGNESELIELRKIAKKRRINNCLFLPNLCEEKIIKYQKGADLLFYIITEDWPTFWCCSPLKIPEYMASGTPILAPSLGSIKEMIDENNAFIFDSEKRSLKSSILEVKSNPLLVEKKSKAALNKVRKNYTWNVRSNLLLKFIEKNF